MPFMFNALDIAELLGIEHQLLRRMKRERPAGTDVAALTSAAAAQLICTGRADPRSPCRFIQLLVVDYLYCQPVSSAPLDSLLAVLSGIRHARIYSITANTADTERCDSALSLRAPLVSRGRLIVSGEHRRAASVAAEHALLSDVVCSLSPRALSGRA